LKLRCLHSNCYPNVPAALSLEAPELFKENYGLISYGSLEGSECVMFALASACCSIETRKNCTYLGCD